MVCFLRFVCSFVVCVESDFFMEIIELVANWGIEKYPAMASAGRMLAQAVPC